jgi:hypothetical protein
MHKKKLITVVKSNTGVDLRFAHATDRELFSTKARSPKLLSHIGLANKSLFTVFGMLGIYLKILNCEGMNYKVYYRTDKESSTKYNKAKKKISPVSCFPTVPKFYPPTLNFLWPQIKLHTKTFFLDIQTRKNVYIEQF